MTLLHYNATKPTVSDGRTVQQQADSRGNTQVTLIAQDGITGANVIASNADAQSGATNGLLVMARTQLFNGSTFDRETKPNVVSRIASSAATNNATSAKATAGNVFTVTGVNTNAAARYLKFYNKASAPNPAADTPFWVEYLPPTAVNGGKFSLDFGANPLYFSTGIAWALVTGSSDTDNTAVSSGDILALNIAYS